MPAEPRSSTRLLYLYFSLLALLVNVTSPQWVLDIPTSYMLKDLLHATASEVSWFRLITGIPLMNTFSKNGSSRSGSSAPVNCSSRIRTNPLVPSLNRTNRLKSDFGITSTMSQYITSLAYASGSIFAGTALARHSRQLSRSSSLCMIAHSRTRLKSAVWQFALDHVKLFRFPLLLRIHRIARGSAGVGDR